MLTNVRKKLNPICVFSACLALALLLGCSSSLFCDFTNHSGDRILLVLATSAEKDTVALEPGQSVRVGRWRSTDFSVVRRERTLRYAPVTPPASFIYYEGPLSKRIFRARLESDGKIYMESSERELPIQQPEGFPLEGKIVDGA